MATSYGQFCPVAVAAEVLTERWTPLVLRELMCGSARFNDLRRGVPLMSPSLLSKRLKALERAGILERHRGQYRLTEAGEELRPLIEGLGAWGRRWARGDASTKNWDAGLLMWDIHRKVARHRLPDHRVIVHFHLRESRDGRSDFWLILERESVDLCLSDPRHEVDVEVEAHVQTMIEFWLGRVDLAAAARAGDISLRGPRHLVRALPTWFERSLFPVGATGAPLP